MEVDAVTIDFQYLYGLYAFDRQEVFEHQKQDRWKWTAWLCHNKSKLLKKLKGLVACRTQATSL